MFGYTQLYLNDGMGDPCAGQVRATPPPRTLLIPLMSRSEDNFGFALPIGSEIEQEKNVDFPLRAYLNDGMGDPWAGQVRATPARLVFLELLKSDSDDSLGFALPMGSEG